MTKIAEIKHQLSSLKSKAYDNFHPKDRPTKKEAALVFFNNCGVSMSFILREKENILFAFLSLAVLWADIF